jgi:hypothetical protein
MFPLREETETLFPNSFSQCVNLDLQRFIIFLDSVSSYKVLFGECNSLLRKPESIMEFACKE